MKYRSFNCKYNSCSKNKIKNKANYSYYKMKIKGMWKLYKNSKFNSLKKRHLYNNFNKAQNNKKIFWKIQIKKNNKHNKVWLNKKYNTRFSKKSYRRRKIKLINWRFKYLICNLKYKRPNNKFNSYRLKGINWIECCKMNNKIERTILLL